MCTDTPEPLRVVLVHSTDSALPVWAARLIEWLHQDPAFLLVGRIEGHAPPPSQHAFSLILSLERMMHRGISGPVSTARAEKLLAELPVLSGDSEGPVADIALALSRRALSVAELSALVTEEWSLLMADAPPWLADRAIMQALSAGAPTIPLALMARTAREPEGQCILSAQYNIKPSAILMSAFLFDKAVPFVQRALKCRAFGREVDSGVTSSDQDRPTANTKPLPYPAKLLDAVARRLVDKARERLDRPADNWELHVGDSFPPKLELSTLTPLPRLSWMMADPFLLDHEGALYLFFEALDKKGGNAWIEVCRLNGSVLEPLGVALRCDYHLSFPQVFAHAGEIYMMPETQQTNRLEIWRATRFPLEWELHATALEGLVPADSCLFHEQGKWWLFSNLSDHHTFQEHSSALYLFEVDGPDLKKITPHRLNPIVIGSDVSRNAGSIFSVNGQLYRPSQNNSYGVYGYGLNLMRIDRLDARDYHETLTRRITPHDMKGAQGVHHVSFAQGRFVLDVYMNRSARAI